MRLSALVERIEYQLMQGTIDVDVVSIQNDSRKISAGDLFFCIPGSVVDGHSFAADVAEKGASVLVVEHEVDVPQTVTVIRVASARYAMAMIAAAFYGYPSEKLTVIGITGTKGKTTTTYMMHSMLTQAGHQTGLIGTIETMIGDVHVPSENTTPESLTLQRSLKDMVDQGLDSVVMEVSSQGLMLDRVAGVDFDYGIFSNLSEDHIGPNEHKTFDEYKMWKKQLFQMCKVGFFNADDPYADYMMKDVPCKVITYGVKTDADFRADHIRLYHEKGTLGVEYTVSGGMHADVIVNMPGNFSVHNSLAAICVAKAMGVPDDKILSVLKAITVKGRVELIPISDAFTILIDYAHNAVSLESILDCLRDYQPKRLISVFGCGGNRSRVRRFEMGEVSGNMADLTIITSDNPRDEDPMEIIHDIVTGIEKTDGAYIEIPDRKEAVRYAILHAQAGDVIVLAGKGHEDYQIIKGVKYHMDERELIHEVLEEENVEQICGYHNRYFS